MVLADSVRSSGRCLAGKEVLWTGADWSVGGWVRPVPTPTGAEMALTEVQRALGWEPSLLEVVEIPLERPCPLPDQPENWLLSRTGAWKLHGCLEHGKVPTLLDHPDQLWGDEKRYVQEGCPQRMAQPAPLYLIQPDTIGPLRIWAEEALNEQGQPYARHRRRVAICCRGRWHEFDITDPRLQARYYPKLPASNEPSLTIRLRSPQRTVVCVSLTPVWKGRHYKIAAAFLEPPEPKES